MNLLDKIWKLLFVITMFAVISCDDPSEIALGLTPDAISSQVSYEEINLLAENVFIDSLRTSNSSKLLVGKNTSDIFGTTSSIALSQLSAQVFSPQGLVFVTDTITDSPLEIDTLSSQFYVYDSTILTLEYIYANSNDIGETQRISVHKLDDEIFSGVYYLSNFNTPYLENDPNDVFDFNINEELLDSALAHVADTSNTYTLDLKLSNSIGESLFNLIRDADSNNTLRKNFKGIALVGGEENTAIIGFNPAGATELIVHYHIQKDSAGIISTASDSLELRFSLANANARYNKIETDRSGSLIGNSISENLVEFDTDDNKVYLQPGSGIYPKISLQPLYDFFNTYDKENGELIQINRAIISIQTTKNTNKYNLNINDLRFLFMREGSQINTSGLNTNDVRSTIVITDQGYFSSVQDALIAPFITRIDTLSNITTYSYEAPMTFFVQQLESGFIETDKLVLMPSELNTMNQSIFEIEEMKLQLYYSITN